MPEHAPKSRARNRYWWIPVAVFVVFCAVEWLMWIFTPNAFFYSRGRTGRNLNYTSTIHGDLSTDNIFVTPQVRPFHYTTDAYSARNNTTVRRTDVLMIGQSFSTGGGSSQEFMPVNQLSRMTGYTAVNVASRDVLFPGYDPYEMAAFALKFKKPVAPKILVFDIIDILLSEELAGTPPVEKIKTIINTTTDYPSLTLMQRFDQGKKYVKDFSPQAIIARKLKTLIKMKFLSVLYKLKFFKRTSKTLDYIDHDGEVYAVPKLSQKLLHFSENSNTLRQMVEALDLLNQYAHQQNILFLVSITPAKMIAYNRFVDTADKIEGFGPAQLLYDRLRERGIQVVMLHPDIFKAVEDEMLYDGPFVYWGDDTHWGPYGIEIGMRRVAEKLRELDGNLPFSAQRLKLPAGGIVK